MKTVYLVKLSELKVNTDRKATTIGKLLSCDQEWLFEEIIWLNISGNILSFPPLNEWRQFLIDLTKILRSIFQINITILLLLVIKKFIRSLECVATWIWHSALSRWITCPQMLIVPTLRTNSDNEQWQERQALLTSRIILMSPVPQQSLSNPAPSPAKFQTGWETSIITHFLLVKLNYLLGFFCLLFIFSLPVSETLFFS